MTEKKEMPEAQIPRVRKPQLHRKLRVLLAKMGTTEVLVMGTDDDAPCFVVSSLPETKEREAYDQEKPRGR